MWSTRLSSLAFSTKLPKRHNRGNFWLGTENLLSVLAGMVSVQWLHACPGPFGCDLHSMVNSASEEGRLPWPGTDEAGDTLALSSAQLSMSIEGVDWRAPERR